MYINMKIELEKNVEHVFWLAIYILRIGSGGQSFEDDSHL